MILTLDRIIAIILLVAIIAVGAVHFMDNSEPSSDDATDEYGIDPQQNQINKGGFDTVLGFIILLDFICIFAYFTYGGKYLFLGMLGLSAIGYLYATTL